MKVFMHLWRRENGIYYIVWRDRDGRQRMRSTRTKDKALARRIFNQFKREWLAGKLVELDRGPKKSLEDFIGEFLEWASNVKPYESFRTYRAALNHLLKNFGRTRSIQSLTSKDFDQLLVSLGREGLSPVTINKIFRHIKAAFSKAVEWGYLKANPVKKGNPIPQERPLPRFLTQEEIKRLLRVIDDPLFVLLVEFALYSGLRRSEIVSLTWDHIMPQGFIRIPSGKNHEERFLPVSERLARVLHDLRAINPDGERLFPYNKDWVSHKFKAYAKKAGLSEVRFHDLRHTFASHLVMSGVDIRTVQALMGHKALQATMIYAHLAPDHLKQAIEKLNYGPTLRIACKTLAGNRRGKKIKKS